MIKKSIEDLISFQEDEITNSCNEKPILIFDGHNLAHRTVFSCIKQDPLDNDKFILWKHIFINSLLNSIKKFEPSKVILTFDGFKHLNWRKQVYAEYKSHRKKARDESAVDFEKFYPVLNSTIDDIRYVFSKFYTITARNCEADDIIAVLTRQKFLNKPIIIISGDKDMNQLLDCKNVRQFDATKNRFIDVINPKKDLQIKVLSGDFQSDHIPPIKRGVGKVTAAKMLNEGLDIYFDKDKEMKKNYERNLKLIDFNYIPEDIQQEILNTFNQIEIKDINSNSLMKFFVANKMIKSMEDWQIFSKYVKNLT